MLLTYFCKRGRHSDCPGEWPMGDPCDGNNDCSFDVSIRRCNCECHQAWQYPSYNHILYL